MWAVVTGASSGIGREIAILLSRLGYQVVISARREDRLLTLQKELLGESRIVVADLATKQGCLHLYKQTEGLDVEILINCAGFGEYGLFVDCDLDRELRMIDLNIKSVQILSKLYLRDFVKNDRGYILNVASSAGFMPGPYMATYYATKGYVVRFSQAVARELKIKKSNVYFGILCPGPVDTEFNSVAGVRFALPGMTATKIAKAAVSGMLHGRQTIIPGAAMKLSIYLAKFAPTELLTKITAQIQKSKGEGRK